MRNLLASGLAEPKRKTGALLVVLLAGVLMLAIAIPAALAIPIRVIDDAGPDDEPGQKDLNEYTVEFDTAAADLEVSWQWDVIDVGGSTADACSLYDTDNDGNANYSLCVEWGDGATYETTRLYECGDGEADKCDNPRVLLAEDTDGDGDLEEIVGGPYASTCMVTGTVPDTFGPRTGAQAATDLDTEAICQIELDDFGGGDAFLTNVCSYPSQVPGSSPSDCIVTPNSGFLTIVKVADPDDGTGFVFDASEDSNICDNSVDPPVCASSWTINGSGSVNLISYPATTTLDLLEVIPADWLLQSASCELSDGTSTGTFAGATVTDLEIQVGRQTTCTFANEKLAALTLVKEVTNDNGGTATEDQWTLTADGTADNDLSGVGPEVTGMVEADVFTLSESNGPSGYTAGAWSCSGDGGTLSDAELTLAPGAEVTCTIVNDDDAPSLTLVKDVVNDNGGGATADQWTLSAGGNDVSGSAGGVEATDQAGTYALSESVVAGYTNTSITCDNDPDVEVTEVTIGLGESVTCTFVNDDDAPSLTLVKDMVNDNGGTAGEGDWSLNAEGYNAALPQTGTFDLSEDGPGGYTLTSLTCTNSGDAQVTSVTLGLGEDVTCTFVNDDNAPSLTLVKDVTNDNGGTAVETDWTLTASGPTGFSGQTGVTSDASFDQGAYDLAETGPGGYAASDWVCVGGTQDDGDTITLGLGDSATCTITNDDVQPLLTVTKTVVNDNGGTAEVGDFPLFVDATPVGSGVENGFDAGSYVVSETELAGYTASEWGGDCAADGSIILAVGDIAECTITNDDDAPSLTLVKDVVNDNGGTAVTSAWTLTADGPTGFSGPTGVASDASFDQGTYDLAESGPEGYVASDWVCVGGTQDDGDTITLGLGDAATCTITNDDDAPSLTLVKDVVNDNGGTAMAAEWMLSADGPTPISGFGGASSDAGFSAGTYDLSEDGPAAYDASAWACEGDGTQDGAAITLGLGESATCTITNDDKAPGLTLVKEVVNDNGGEATPDAWTLVAAGYDPSDPQTGTYPLSETGPNGYTLTSLTCDNADGEVTSVTLQLGESVTCRFVNDDDAPLLTLIKEVVNDNGGLAVETDWALTADGPRPISGAGGVSSDASFEAGTYTLSESIGPVGYAASVWVCEGDGIQDGDQITVGLGDVAECTITNDDVQPLLTVTKTVVNDNGGTAEVADFPLFVDVTPVVSGVENGFDAGGYVVSEAELDGYTASEWGGDCAADGSITLVVGDVAECTITNDDKAPGLTLVKEVVNDNGGTAVATDWTLTAAGYDPTDPAVGTYELSETGPGGYTLTLLECDNDSGTSVASPFVTLGLGESLTCTFTNDDDAPSLTLVKDVVNDNGGTAEPGDWTLTADGYTAALPQVGTYDLSEDGPAGYTLTSLTCSNSGDTQVTSVTLGLGEDVTCTFVNDDDAPSLTLAKVVENGASPGGTAVPTDWTLTADGYDPVLRQTGTYALSESGPDGYLLTSLTCDNAVGQVSSVTLGLGEDVTCTFVNTAVAHVEVNKTVNGVPASGYTFEIREGASTTSAGTVLATGTTDISGFTDFGGYELIPGNTYQLCETAMMPGWSNTLNGFTPEGAVAEGGDNSTECVDFTPGIGETVVFDVDNTPPPGGDARTIGFWKNWTSCDGHGNQDPVLDETLAAAGGTIVIGDFEVSTCAVAVDVLDKRQIRDRDVVKDGRKRAGDAAYSLAAQLLAAQLNVVAGAGTCSELTDAISEADDLLAGIGFDGQGNYLRGKSNRELKIEAVELAGILDDYNNNLLCTP